MKEGVNVNLSLSTLEDRVSELEKKVFGDEIISNSQQKRQIIEEMVQINSQITSSLSSREIIINLMKKIEDMIEYLELEEGCQVLGGEAKANAVLAAEPVITQMYSIAKNMNMDEINSSMNSQEIRNLINYKGQLAELKLTQFGQESDYDQLSLKIRAIEEAVSLLVAASQNS